MNEIKRNISIWKHYVNYVSLTSPDAGFILMENGRMLRKLRNRKSIADSALNSLTSRNDWLIHMTIYSLKNGTKQSVSTMAQYRVICPSSTATINQTRARSDTAVNFVVVVAMSCDAFVCWISYVE